MAHERSSFFIILYCKVYAMCVENETLSSNKKNERHLTYV